MPTFKQCIDFFTKKYEWIMTLILKGKHVQVNREKYIRHLVDRFYSSKSREEKALLVQKAKEGTPLDILTPGQCQKAYSALRWHYGIIVFLVSFFATLVPDNIFIIIISCAIDLYVFQCMVFRSMQKILILYGQPLDLTADKDSGISTILSIDRSGIMIGKHTILQRLKSGAGVIAKQIVKEVGPKLIAKFSRSAFFVIRRQFIKWFSIIVLRDHVTLVFHMLIPITCAVISGIVSVVILIPMCNKLQKSILIPKDCEL